MTTEYLTDAEVARRLRWAVYTLRDNVRRGRLREGEHFFRIPGTRMRRWKWEAVVSWIEGEVRDREQGEPKIRLAR